MKFDGVVVLMVIACLMSGCSSQASDGSAPVSVEPAVNAEVWQQKIDGLNGQLIASQQALTDAQVEIQRLQALLESQTTRLNDQLASITALEQDLAHERSLAQTQQSRWATLRGQIEGMQKQWQDLYQKFPELFPQPATGADQPSTTSEKLSDDN